MEEEIQDGSEVQETTEEVVEETTPEAPQLTAEEIADLKRKAEVSSQNYERAKKAEAELKEVREKVPAHSEENLSTKDVLALTESKVSSDDYDEVLRVAKILGKPVHQALKDETMQMILNTRAEQRRTADATQIRGARGTSKVSGEDLLNRAEKSGEVPETDEGMQELFKARLARRFAK